MCSLGYSLELAIMFVIRPALALHHLIVTIFLISFRLPAAFRLDEETAKKDKLWCYTVAGSLYLKSSYFFLATYLYL